MINEIDLTFQSDTVCNNITNNRTLNRLIYGDYIESEEI